MTYLDLLTKLRKMTDRELEGYDVTVYLTKTDEYFAVQSFKVTGETDVLDEGHPILIIEA